MKRFFTSELFFALLALTVTAVLLFTRDVSMSATVQNMLLAFFAVAVLAYTTFIYREMPADEREYEMSLIASKRAYLVGSALLSVGIVVQVIRHELGFWLPTILASMVIVKTISYFNLNK